MKEYPLSVFVGVDKTKGFDVSVLNEAAKSGKEAGPLDVLVKFVTKDGVNIGYSLTGNAIAVAPDDLLDEKSIASVNERLARDLGTIGSVQTDDPLHHEYEAGQDVDVTYVLNHGGLPLNYGTAIKNTFKVLSGRVNTTDITMATLWFSANDPGGMGKILKAGGINALTKEWIGEGRPMV